MVKKASGKWSNPIVGKAKSLSFASMIASFSLAEKYIVIGKREKTMSKGFYPSIHV